MAKTELPPRGSENRTLAIRIFEHIKPSNPHGPTSDLVFGDGYVMSESRTATRIANDLLGNGYRPPRSLVEELSDVKIPETHGYHILQRLLGEEKFHEIAGGYVSFLQASEIAVAAAESNPFSEVRIELRPDLNKALDLLDDGTYNDGTYDWEKEGRDWRTISPAPSGMPTRPDPRNLRRVKITRTYEEL
jgi:hypothetical protein